MAKKKIDQNISVEYINSPETSGSMDDVIQGSAVFDTSGMKRKQLIKDAQLLANNSDSSKGFTWSDYVNGRVENKDKFSRREDLYRRKFFKQLKKNAHYTEQQRLLEAAKEGDPEAMGKYVASKRDDEAPKYAPLVAGPALAVLAETGALGAAIKGVQKLYSNPLARTAFDVIGTGDAINNAISDNGIQKTARLWKEGDTWGTIKSAAGDVLDIAGVGDMFTNPYLRSGLRSLAGDTVQSFNDMVNGVEPVIGLTPWVERSWRDVERVQGLGNYDLQNLLDRGYTREQIARLRDTQTPNLTGNFRANELARRLAEMGISPAERSRRQFLEEAVAEGQDIVTDRYGRPMTFEEGMREGVPVRPSGLGWVNAYYPTQSVVTPTIYNDPNYKSLMQKLSKAVGVIDTSISADIRPKIQQILEQGVRLKSTPEDIESQLAALFKSYGKPWITKETSIYAPLNGVPYDPQVDWDGGRTHVTSEIPTITDLENYLKHGNSRTSQIRLEPYDSETVSYDFNPGDDDYSPNHFWLFNINSPDKKAWLQQIWDSTFHGGVSTERSKSLQSNFEALMGYTGRAKNGDGVIVFANDGNGNYVMDKTNEAAATMWRPGMVGSGDDERMVADSAKKLMRANMMAWNQLLSQVDPRAFVGGNLPSLDVSFRYPHLEDPVTISLPVKMVDGKPSIDASELYQMAAKYDDELAIARQSRIDRAKSEISSILGENGVIDLPDGRMITFDPNTNKLVVIQRGQDPIDLQDFSPSGLPSDLSDKIWRLGMAAENLIYPRLHGYGINIQQPRVGFRKFNNGGVLNKLNKNSRKLLGIWC